MQLPEDCTRTRSPPPPLRSLSPLSLALCLAGSSPGQAQSRSGPVGTSYSTTSVTFCRNDWAWTSWVWTCTTAAVSSKKSTSMSGWVCAKQRRGQGGCQLGSAAVSWCVFVGLVHPWLFRNCSRVQQQSLTSCSEPSSHFYEEMHLWETHQQPTWLVRCPFSL